MRVCVYMNLDRSSSVELRFIPSTATERELLNMVAQDASAAAALGADGEHRLAAFREGIRKAMDSIREIDGVETGRPR